MHVQKEGYKASNKVFLVKLVEQNPEKSWHCWPSFLTQPQCRKTAQMWITSLQRMGMILISLIQRELRVQQSWRGDLNEQHNLIVSFPCSLTWFLPGSVRWSQEGFFFISHFLLEREQENMTRRVYTVHYIFVTLHKDIQINSRVMAFNGLLVIWFRNQLYIIYHGIYCSTYLKTIKQTFFQLMSFENGFQYDITWLIETISFWHIEETKL